MKSTVARILSALGAMCCALPLSATAATAPVPGDVEQSYLSQKDVPANLGREELESFEQQFAELAAVARARGDASLADRAEARRIEVLARRGRVMERPERLAAAHLANTQDPTARVLALNALALAWEARHDWPRANQESDRTLEAARALTDNPPARLVADVLYDHARRRATIGKNRDAFAALMEATDRYIESGLTAAAMEALFRSVGIRILMERNGAPPEEARRQFRSRTERLSMPAIPRPVQTCNPDGMESRKRLHTFGLVLVEFDIATAGEVAGAPRILNERGDAACTEYVKECLQYLLWPPDPQRSGHFRMVWSCSASVPER